MVYEFNISNCDGNVTTTYALSAHVPPDVVDLNVVRDVSIIIFPEEHTPREYVRHAEPSIE